MDTTYFLQSAQEAGGEVLEPVGTWGGTLSGEAIAFFQNPDMHATVSVEAASKYFLEAMKVASSDSLKHALCNVHSIVRGNIFLYGALADASCVAVLTTLAKAHDATMSDKAASLLAGVMCRFSQRFTVAQVKALADYSGTEAGKLDVLANLLKYDAWRKDLFEAASMRILSGVSSSSVPVVYKGLMCVWLASFNKATTIPVGVITSVNEVLKSTRTEKVIRMALLAIENLLKNRAMCEEMADQGTVGFVSALEYEKWRDMELIDLIKKLTEKLHAEVKVLTNFERFEREINSGRLKWGFIHTEKFWLENVLKCESNNFRVIDHLMVIVRTAKDPETLAVACHDLGEFARLHPIGKQIANNKGAKDKMLELMSNSQREVAREALLCVQKLMLQSGSLTAIRAN